MDDIANIVFAEIYIGCGTLLVQYYWQRGLRAWVRRQAWKVIRWTK